MADASYAACEDTPIVPESAGESEDTKMILTDSKIEEMADKICELVVKSVNAYHDKHSLDAEAIEPCEVCPFTEYCAKGQTGFTEFFKQEVNK